MEYTDISTIKDYYNPVEVINFIETFGAIATIRTIDNNAPIDKNARKGFYRKIVAKLNDAKNGREVIDPKTGTIITIVKRVAEREDVKKVISFLNSEIAKIERCADYARSFNYAVYTANTEEINYTIYLLKQIITIIPNNPAKRIKTILRDFVNNSHLPEEVNNLIVPLIRSFTKERIETVITDIQEMYILR